jgi:hypothetical protein
MDRGEIAALRLANLQIAASRARHPGPLVAALGAVQAQDYTGALWTMGLRVPGATEAEVERAVARREVVRTWPMRGTLHFVAAADVRWMLALLTPRVILGRELRREQLELDEVVLSRCRKGIVKALEGNRQITRQRLLEVLKREKISTDDGRGYHILTHLAQEGLICFGAREGKQLTFALLDEWAPPVKGSDRDRNAALAELAGRYFASHGPATVQDFAWWSGLKMSDARAGLDAVSSSLVKETIDGVAYWMPGDSVGLTENRAAYLLPGFDEYLLGYTDRTAVLAAIHAEKIVPGGNGMFLPTLVLDGQVAGTWKRTVKRRTVAVTVMPFRPLKKAGKAALQEAADRYGEYLTLPAEVIIV